MDSESAALVYALRRMIAEPDQTLYADSELIELIHAHGVTDTKGRQPDNVYWVPTYDLNRVAGDIWAEKASSYVIEHDFRADGGDFTRSQKYQHALRQAQYYSSRSRAKSVIIR